MGYVKIKWEGPAITAKTRAAATRGLAQAAEFVLGESRKVVPIEEGTLERSGRVTMLTENGEPVAAISYSTPYARRQHEELTWRHDPGRTAKYLERPMLEQRATAYEIVAEAMRKATS